MSRDLGGEEARRWRWSLARRERRANGQCIDCCAPSAKFARCLACRRKQVGYLAGRKGAECLTGEP